MVFNCAIENIAPGDLVWIDQSESAGWHPVDRIVDCTSDKIAPVFFICWGKGKRTMAAYPGTSFTVLKQGEIDE